MRNSAARQRNASSLIAAGRRHSVGVTEDGRCVAAGIPQDPETRVGRWIGTRSDFAPTAA
ncbi:RCC1-like domain-containing protein [Gordonia otitidis]|uniref:RCC1-like domain-containing protein n=1 Tax=Gordonia otitidis TaxID=249058 RepID=UPI0038993C08